jgi:hypothetical protein
LQPAIGGGASFFRKVVGRVILFSPAKSLAHGGVYFFPELLQKKANVSAQVERDSEQ